MNKELSETPIRSPIDVQIRKQELHIILHEVDDVGFVALPINKLLRLLGRGNKSGRTWRELLDEWEEIGFSRDELHAYVTPWQGTIILTKRASTEVKEMAGE